MFRVLFLDADYLACANGTATFADSELETFVHSNRSDELNVDFYVITRHNHFLVSGEHDLTGNIQGTDEELRTVMVVERGMTATFFFLQNIDLSNEVGVRSDGLGSSHNFTSLNLFLVNATEEETYVIASLTLREELAEHLDTGNNGSTRFVTETNEFDGVIDVDGTSLDTTGNNGTTASDGEDVLDRHEEGLVNETYREGNVLVNSVHELHNFLFPLRLTVEGAECGPADDRAVLVEVVECEEVTDFHLNEVEHFLIVNKVNLVHENEDLRNVNLTGEKDVLTGLGHRTVGRSDDEDCTVHLSSTGNHVLNVVGVARAVYVSIVTFLSLILNMSGVDGDTTFLFLGSVIDRIKRSHFGKTSFSQNFGDSSGQGSFTVVNVTDCTHIYVGFCTFVMFFCHFL